MIIEKLELKSFGRFQNETIELGPGLNLIEGKNESGKSTVHSFIRGMLFGMERLRGRAGKEDLYTKYLPWDSPAVYGGSMDFELDGSHYRIIRSFHRNQKSVSCLCLETGREVPLSSGKITDFIHEFTETLYRNTVSMEQQKAKTDAELAEQVRNYIANIATTKSSEVDVRLALKMLGDKKKALESEDCTGKIEALEKNIEEGQACEDRTERLALRQRELLARQNELTGQIGDLKAQAVKRFANSLDQLPAILEKYKVYGEMMNQAGLLESRENEIRLNCEAAKRDRKTNEKRRKSLNELASLAAERREIENKKRELTAKQREEAFCAHAVNRKRSAVLAAAGLIMMIVCLLLRTVPGIWIGTYAGLAAVMAGALLYVVSEKKMQKQWMPYETETASLEQRLLMLESRRHDILLEYNVLDEKDLRAKYDAGLKSEAIAEHLARQADNCAEQKKQIQWKAANNRNEIMTYANRFLKEVPDTPDEALMKELASRVGECRENLKKRLYELEEERREGRLHLEKIKWELDRVAENEGKLNENKMALKQLKEKQSRIREELAAVTLSACAIEELSTQIHDSFGIRFNEAVSGLVDTYTDGEHKKAFLDEKMNVKVACGQEIVPLERLSGGTVEQIYLALRLSVAGFLIGRNDIPILLDDSFAYYDDDRMKLVLAWLAQQKERQVLLFTCQDREREALEEMRLSYHSVQLSGRA